MRKSLCALGLVLALCGSAFAGDIQTPPVLAPGDIQSPPDASQTPSAQASDGWIDTGEAALSDDGIIHGDEADGMTSAALSVLNSVLSLL